MVKSISILFLRGNSFEYFIGQTDIEIAFCLDKVKYSISILSRNNSKSSIKYYNGVKIIEIRFFNIKYIGGLLFNIMAFIKCRKIYFDVIIVNPGLFCTSIIYKLFNKDTKIVLDIRSIPVDGTKISLLVPQFMQKCALYSPFISGITIISEPMMEYLKKSGVKIRNIPIGYWGSGVNLSLFYPRENNKSKDRNYKQIIYHGTISKSRGISNLIKSIKCLLEEGFPNITLLLIGNGKDVTQLKKEVYELGINDNVYFMGPYPYDKVPEIISNSDLAIIPFPDHVWWRFQSPIKIFEYLAMGIPVIATDLIAHRNISQAISLIPNNDPITIKNAIKEFFNLDSTQIENLKNIAVNDSKKYSWQNKAKLLTNFLDNRILGDND